MSALDAATVRSIAGLARLELSEAEVERLVPELSAILDYVEQLDAVDTEGVEPTAFAGAASRFRPPELRLRVNMAGQAIRVPRVI